MFTGFIGTYTQEGAKGQGIYSFAFDPLTASVHDLKLAFHAINPSYLVVSPSKRFLFAALESENGSVCAFALHKGSLELLNTQSSRGNAPCHLALSPDERFLIVSNYGSATIALLPIAEDGSLSQAVQTISLSGCGPHKMRQESAHAHSCTFSPDGNFVFACDLGSDRVIVYRFERSLGRLIPTTQYSSQAGAGPRHMIFSPDGTNAYVANELASTVDLIAAQGPGAPSLRQRLSTVPKGFSADNTAAAIKLSVDGKYLYVSNRGHDSIAVYAVQSDATLDFIAATLAGGKTPRDFAVDPSGAFLLVCHQDSDTMAVFSRDEYGLLHHRATYSLPSGVCILCADLEANNWC
ncbi:MAG: lactonase family protein [Spirochaetaceae bacterium]|jgi:6-phosphogluconolactonase|nr:lactonase family protein [Spirochaetaceae bacterium]